MTIFAPPADPFGGERHCRVCDYPLAYDDFTREWYCPLTDHVEPEPEKEPEEITPRKKRRRFHPGFYVTSAADDILQSIPKGLRSRYINNAIEQYARNPTREKREK